MTSPPPLRPLGGPWYKNLLASSLVRLGQRPAQVVADRARIDRRVPPEPGGARLYNDSFVFVGSDADGTLLMSRLGLRETGEQAETWLWLDWGGRKLAHPRPDGPADAPGALAAAGLRYTRDDARDRWRVAFSGALEDAAGETARVELDLEYAPQTEAYLSSAHMDPMATGKAMAEMPWSREYFQRLGSERQVRMEQGGLLTGRVSVDGAERAVTLAAVRDHSWGKRDWTFLNRYVWNIVSLEAPLVLSGTPLTHLCYTTVDYGDSFSHLVSGWIAGPDAVWPIVAASDMAALAADGVIPARYPIVFQPRGEGPVRGTVERAPRHHSWLMQSGAFEVNEAYCRVTLEPASGPAVSGHGMSEFGFSRASGIPRPAFEGPR